jgi:hypothetical protein
MSTSHGSVPPAGRQAGQHQFDREGILELSQPVSGKAGGVHRAGGRGPCAEARTGRRILR